MSKHTDLMKALEILSAELNELSAQALAMPLQLTDGELATMAAYRAFNEADVLVLEGVDAETMAKFPTDTLYGRSLIWKEYMYEYKGQCYRLPEVHDE